MKKAVAVVLVVVMMLAFGATAFAAGRPLSVNEAKQIALNHAGVNAADASFTKAHRDWENGREVYEFEFYANATEYDVDVDVNTGAVTHFSTESYGTYGSQQVFGGAYHYDDDWDDPYDLDDWDGPFDWDD